MAKKKSNIFTGCMFLGIGIGFLVGHIIAGTLIGIGAGYILKDRY